MEVSLFAVYAPKNEQSHYPYIVNCQMLLRNLMREFGFSDFPGTIPEQIEAGRIVLEGDTLSHGFDLQELWECVEEPGNVIFVSGTEWSTYPNGFGHSGISIGDAAIVHASASDNCILISSLLKFTRRRPGRFAVVSYEHLRKNQ